MVHVTDARYVSGYVLWLRFSDGTEGEVDLEGELHGEIFAPLRDKSYFRSFKVALDTVTWPNGADFASEFLHERVRVRAQPPAAADQTSRFAACLAAEL